MPFHPRFLCLAGHTPLGPWRLLCLLYCVVSGGVCCCVRVGTVSVHVHPLWGMPGLCLGGEGVYGRLERSEGERPASWRNVPKAKERAKLLDSLGVPLCRTLH